MGRGARRASVGCGAARGSDRRDRAAPARRAHPSARCARARGARRGRDAHAAGDRQRPLRARRVFVRGDELFDFSFRPENGLGNALAGREGVRAGGGAPPNLRRVHEGELGGPDALSCSSCHSLGGLDGAGANTQNAFFRGDGDDTTSADERNPPHVLGLGPVDALAREMTRELAAIREAAIAEATATAADVQYSLTALGVEFLGRSRVDADGGVIRAASKVSIATS